MSIHRKRWQIPGGVNDVELPLEYGVKTIKDVDFRMVSFYVVRRSSLPRWQLEGAFFFLLHFFWDIEEADVVVEKQRRKRDYL